MARLFFSDFLTIDIGFRYIKIAQVRKGKNDLLSVINFGIGDTPKNCIKNGAIKDKEKVTLEIKRMINEHKLAAKEAKIVISGTNIITRIIMIEKVTDGNIEKKILDEIRLYMPIDIDEHSVDFKILDNVREDGKEKMKVFVTAVPKKIISSYIDILNNLGLKPIAVDIPANSVSKFFQREIGILETENWYRKQEVSKHNTNTFAVIDMGSETTIVNILKNKISEFNRVALIGSSDIDLAIYNELDLQKHQYETAERYKKMYGLVSRKNLNNELEWQCSNAAKTVINDIFKNIIACFDFYTTRCAGEKVSRIYLIGGGSQLLGLREYMESVLSIPTYPINLLSLSDIVFSQDLNKEKVNYLINALGIAL